MTIRDIVQKCNFEDVDYAVHVWTLVNKVLVEQGTWCPFHEEHGPCEICGGVEEFVDYKDGKTIPIYGFTAKYIDYEEAMYPQDDDDCSVFHIVC